MITWTYSKLLIERFVVLNRGETKLGTLEETSRFVVPPGGSDDGSLKTISLSLSILVTSGASLDQTEITNNIHMPKRSSKEAT